jgi:GTPase SAR1 family protein
LPFAILSFLSLTCAQFFDFCVLYQVLLMGKSGSGKTSMRSIIFANYLGLLLELLACASLLVSLNTFRFSLPLSARDTFRLGATLEVEHSHVRFLGNLVLNLWDCGGYVVSSQLSLIAFVPTSSFILFMCFAVKKSSWSHTLKVSAT